MPGYLDTKELDYRTNYIGKNLAQVLELLRRTEPEYGASCVDLLRKPVLSLNEREIVLLDGTIVEPGRVK
jgi:hypothetical protein